MNGPELDGSLLDGSELDAAVARAMGFRHVAISPDGLRCWAGNTHQDQEGGFFAPSTNWAQGGPIIERERISLSFYGSYWGAVVHASDGAELPDCDPARHAAMSDGWCPAMATGSAPLIAAMRAFVRSKQQGNTDD